MLATAAFFHIAASRAAGHATPRHAIAAAASLILSSADALSFITFIDAAGTAQQLYLAAASSYHAHQPSPSQLRLSAIEGQASQVCQE